jgi:hypothetical protein
MLAFALYEVFADDTHDVVAIRRAVYELWRTVPHERRRTMAFLAGQDSNLGRFGSSFLRAVGLASRDLVREGAATGRWRHTAGVAGELGRRVRWLFAGAFHLTPATGFGESRMTEAAGASIPKAEVAVHPQSERAPSPERVRASADRAMRVLLTAQDPEGKFGATLADTVAAIEILSASSDPRMQAALQRAVAWARRAGRSNESHLAAVAGAARLAGLDATQRILLAQLPSGAFDGTLATTSACARALACVAPDPSVSRALDRAQLWLRRAQQPDGGWTSLPTMHATRAAADAILGLRATGVAIQSPAIRRAAAQLLSTQRPDGSWTAPEDASATATAWALVALDAAGDAHHRHRDRAINQLLEIQSEDGLWPTAASDSSLASRALPLRALLTADRRPELTGDRQLARLA